MNTLKGLFTWLVVKRAVIAVALVVLGALGARTPALDRCVEQVVDHVGGALEAPAVKP